jgi:AAA+ ATPase superfamily predicted ATPase
MIIGREQEQRRLREAFDSEYSEFVAVYGRRRVGKTFLVREVFNYKFAFYHTGLSRKGGREQLLAFQSSLEKYGMEKTIRPENWYQAFDMLEKLLEVQSGGKKVVFIDEMPWMDKPRSSFVSALENFWNGWASARKDILLIICGSATSWIINKVIKNHGGLHGRVTYRIHLQPFTLGECEQYAASRHLSMNRRQILEAYMIIGGVPFYWSKLEKGNSLTQNIDNLLFSKDGDLRWEFDDLYASLFNAPEKYIQVIQALGKRKSGLTREEISEIAKIQSNGSLSNILEDLEYCGFIRKYSVIGKKSKGAIYQLIDNYTLFYYSFLYGKDNVDENYWSKITSSPVYNTWCGLSFERVCLQHVSQIKSKLGISGVIANVYSWRYSAGKEGQRGVQIDLLIDRNDETINLCEMKYSKTPYTLTDADIADLENKRQCFIEQTGTKKAVHLTMVTASGLADNSNANEIQSQVTADDLFA